MNTRKYAPLCLGLLAGLVLAAPLRAVDGASPEDCLAAARAGGDYLTRILRPNGQFVYQYSPQADVAATSYNWLRHAGTVAALCQLYGKTQDPRYLDAAGRAAEALKGEVRLVTVDGQQRFALVSTFESTGANKQHGAVAKAGGSALSIFAFDALDQGSGGKTDHLDAIRGLGQYLLAARDPATGVPRSKYLVNDQAWDAWASEYYPGQCLLAFAILQRRDPAKHWDEALHSLMGYQLSRLIARLAGRETTGFDHWTMIGMHQALPLIDPARLHIEGDLTLSRLDILRLVFDYGNTELHNQNVDLDSPSFGMWTIHRDRTTPVAIRLEGLHAIRHMIAAATVPAADAEELVKLQALTQQWDLRLAIAQAALIRGQYPGPVASARIDVTGGVRANLNLTAEEGKGGIVQIDYVQHAISAWLGTPD